MTTISNYVYQAELALAAYARLSPGVPDVPQLQDAGLSEIHARRFADNFLVVDQLNNSLSGLSATIFEEKATGRRYLAIRGTDDGVDLVTGLVNIAIIGSPQLQPQYLILRARVQQWLADGTLPSSFTVSGHSLGGFLATGIVAEFRGNVEHAYLYNAPGLAGVQGGATAPVLQALGIVTPVESAKISNVKADAGISPIAGLGAQVAPPIWIAIENQFLSDVTNPPATRNHSQQVLADALALYGTLAQLDAKLMVDSIGQLFKVSSRENKLTLESALNALRFALLGKAAVDANPTAEGGRESFYQNLYALEESAPYQALRDNSVVRVLVNQNAETLASTAKSDFGYFLAVHHLLPLAIEGASNVLSTTHAALFYQWQSDQEKRAAGATDLTFSDAYLADRAEMLGWKNLYYQKDGNVALRGDRIETLQFTDKSIKEDRTGLDLTLNVVGRNSLLIKTPAEIIFGSDADETLVGGNIAAGDHLYGGGGADVLQGNQGNDYLEGGSGNDTYVWNTGDGFDTILDTDGIGRLVVNGRTISGGIKAAQGDYVNADNLALHFEGDPIAGGVLIVNGDLKIENFTSGDLGIVLNDQGSLAEIQPTTQTYVGGLFPRRYAFYGSDGGDHFTPGVGVSVFLGKAGDDLLEGHHFDFLHGGAGNDIVTAGVLNERGGNIGDNWLSGGPGSDIILGGVFGEIIYGDMERASISSDAIFFSIDQFSYDGLAGSGQFDNPGAEFGFDSDEPRFFPGGITEALNYVLGISESTEVSSLYDDFVDGGAGPDLITGGYGSDVLIGGDGDDRINGDISGVGGAVLNVGGFSGLFGSAGDDYLDGGEGNDRLLDGDGGNDILVGGPGNDTIFSSDAFSLETTYSNYLEGGEGNDFITSSNRSLDGFDVLIGGPGNDTFQVDVGSADIEGGSGSDKYIVRGRLPPFSPSLLPRSLVIIDFDDAGSDVDQLYLPPDLALSNPASTLSLTRDESNLYFGLSGDPNWITIENWFAGPKYKIEQIVFGIPGSDELPPQISAIYDVAAIESRFTTATAGADVLWGSRADDQLAGGLGDDTLFGGAGNDVLAGNEGNDALDGGEGADVYVFNIGDGVDRILDSGSFDTDGILFGPGITPDMLTLGLGSLLINVGENGDAIHIEGFDPNNARDSSSIELFQFADGTQLTYGELIGRGFDIVGSTADDVLRGTNVNDRFTGGAGNDTYFFGRGFGQDVIEDLDTAGFDTDTVLVSADVAPGDLAISRAGDFIALAINGTSDQFSIRWQPEQGYGIERVEFSGDIVWDAATLEAMAASSTNTEPTVANPLVDQAAQEDAPFNFHVPEDTFSDTDRDDILDYSATLANGDPLPAWLRFDSASRNFSGTPAATDVGEIAIRVAATDRSGASATDDFQLIVSDGDECRKMNLVGSDHGDNRDYDHGKRDHEHQRTSYGRTHCDRDDDRPDRKGERITDCLAAYLERRLRYDFEALALELEHAERNGKALNAQEIARRWRVVGRYASALSNEHDEDARGGADYRFSDHGLLGGGAFGGGFGYSASAGALRRVVNLQTLQGLEEGFQRLHS